METKIQTQLIPSIESIGFGSLLGQQQFQMNQEILYIQDFKITFDIF